MLRDPMSIRAGSSQSPFAMTFVIWIDGLAALTIRSSWSRIPQAFDLQFLVG